jgi:hypothetical protein
MRPIALGMGGLNRHHFGIGRGFGGDVAIAGIGHNHRPAHSRAGEQIARRQPGENQHAHARNRIDRQNV